MGLSLRSLSSSRNLPQKALSSTAVPSHICKFECSFLVRYQLQIQTAVSSVSPATVKFHSSAVLDYHLPEYLYQMQFLKINLFFFFLRKHWTNSATNIAMALRTSECQSDLSDHRMNFWWQGAEMSSNMNLLPSQYIFARNFFLAVWCETVIKSSYFSQWF